MEIDNTKTIIYRIGRALPQKDIYTEQQQTYFEYLKNDWDENLVFIDIQDAIEFMKTYDLGSPGSWLSDTVYKPKHNNNDWEIVSTTTTIISVGVQS